MPLLIENAFEVLCRRACLFITTTASYIRQQMAFCQPACTGHGLVSHTDGHCVVQLINAGLVIGGLWASRRSKCGDTRAATLLAFLTLGYSCIVLRLSALDS